MQGGQGVIRAHPLQTLGLPSPEQGGPPDSGLFYDRALRELPPTTVTGYLGVILGFQDRDDDVQLLFHDDNPHEPILRLIVDKNRLMMIFASLGQLLHDRLGLLVEWDLHPVNQPTPSPTALKNGSD